MKILCLFVRFGTEKYKDALPVLDAWYKTHGLLDQRTLWIIDNAVETPSKVNGGASDTVLPGDNHAWEFSAWSRTLHEAGTLDAYDVVHFVTSAFNTLYTGYLGHFDVRMLSYIPTHKACLGHIDSYDQPVEIAGERSQSWIRTCFFFLPATLLPRVNPWAAYADPTRFFSSPNGTEFLNIAPISPDYQHRIRIWLEGQDVGGHTWHSPIQSHHEEAERFQKKALAIVNEHSLSIRLRKLRIRLTDFCWLWTRCQTADFSATPPIDEMDQIVVRRRILGIAP